MRTAFGNECLKRYQSKLPPITHQAVLDDLKRKLVSHVTAGAKLRGAVLSSYGSYYTGFAKHDSDVDLSLTWEGFDPLTKGIDEVEDDMEHKMRRIAKRLARNSFENVRFVTAMIPVVSFVDPKSKLSVDIVGGNTVAVENSSILKPIKQIHPELIGLFVTTVKEWAKAREVVAATVGCMNSYGMTTMCIMFLQDCGIVPHFNKCTGEFGVLTEEDVETAISSFTLPEVYKNVQSDAQLVEALNFLFPRFAAYYHKYDWKTGTISLIQPRRHRKGFPPLANSFMNEYKAGCKSAWQNYHDEVLGGQKMDVLGFDQLMSDVRSRKASGGTFVTEDATNFDNCSRQVHKRDRILSIQEEFARLNTLLSNSSTCDYDAVFEERRKFKKDYVDESKDPMITIFDAQGNASGAGAGDD